MAIINNLSLEINKKIKISFNCGGLSSDAGLLLIREFAEKIGLTGNLLKVELRDGTQYCGKGADQFTISLMEDYRAYAPSLPLYLRGDSGFASPGLHEVCEENDCLHAIRLKQNSVLVRMAANADDALYRATRHNQADHAVEYGEFEYQAGSWSRPRRVVFKVGKPANQLHHLYTFVVTTMTMEPHQIIQFCCGRGREAVHSARYVIFKLCGSCPYKQEFRRTLHNISQLRPLLE